MTPQKTASFIAGGRMSVMSEKRKSELSNRGMNDLKQMISQLASKNAE